MTTNPWDVPPFPATGDGTNVQTFQAVGEALSQWEHFEGHLALCFALLTGGGDVTEPAALAYGSVVSFRGRSDMIEAAMKGLFVRQPNAAIEGELAAILKFAKNFSARRTEIAHGVVQPYIPDGSSTVSGYALVPAYYAANKRTLTSASAGLSPLSMKPKYAYTSKEIGFFCREFEKMAKQLIAFLPKLI